MFFKRVLLFSGIAGQLALSAAFTPAEARRVYGVAVTNSSAASVKEVGEFVFLDVKWTVPDDSDEADEAELEALSNALEAYVVVPPQAITNSPFSTPLTSWLDSEVPYSLPNLSSTVVLTEEKGKDCRKVFAFERKSLQAEKAKCAQAEAKRHTRTHADWAAALQVYYKTLKTEKDFRQFFVLLDCPIVNLVMDRGAGDYGIPVAATKKSWDELESVLKWWPGTNSFFKAHANLLFSQCCAGRKSNLFYPAWTLGDDNRLAEVKKICAATDWVKNPQPVLEILSQSIAANPLDAEKWLYLAGVLLKTNHPQDALIAYIQSAKFDASGKDAWIGIAESCKLCGYNLNADGIYWYLRLRESGHEERNAENNH